MKVRHEKGAGFNPLSKEEGTQYERENMGERGNGGVKV